MNTYKTCRVTSSRSCIQWLL